MQHSEFKPKLLTVLSEGYSVKAFTQDFFSGLTVGVVALPLAIAFAIASGVKPEQGLFTAIIAGLLISLLSGSRVQIGGPTGAFVVLVYGIVAQYGYDGLAVATMLAGILLIIMGAVKLGVIIQYIPYPVTVGFTGGIAVIIAVSQVRDFLGLQIDQLPAEFIHKIAAYADNIGSSNPWAIALGLITIIVIRLWPKVSMKVPGPVVALIVTTVAVQVFNIPVETIGSRFGAVPSSLPVPHIPTVDWATFTELISPAVSIALLAGIESLLSAVVADGMTGRRHSSNMELIAQGVANIASPLFGGIPATGAIARTATNIKSGGRTPVAGIIHALTLLVILMVAGKWASLIPMSTLAGILIIVAYHMGEWHLFGKVAKSTKSDFAVLLVSFMLTVFIDLTVAIQAGVVLAALLFMKRMADLTHVKTLLNEVDEEDEMHPDSIKDFNKQEGILVFEINGPFFFGAAHKFINMYSSIDTPPATMVLCMRNVPAIDATALQALDTFIHRAHKSGTEILLSGVQNQPMTVLKRSGLLNIIGKENIFEETRMAMRHAHKKIKKDDLSDH